MEKLQINIHEAKTQLSKLIQEALSLKRGWLKTLQDEMKVIQSIGSPLKLDIAPN